MTRLRNTRIALIRRVVRTAPDAGVSIIEALVAILIFTLIALGVAQGTMISARTTADSQRRTVALNLAAAQLDLIRTQSAYGISSTTVDAPSAQTTIDGVVYTTVQNVRWVTANGADQSCGATSGSFQLLRVRVTTTWTGQLPISPTATTNGLITPDQTIKDPGKGTIFVSVNKSSASAGAPYANLPVTVIDANSGATISAPNTNSDGCSYVAGLAPGQYIVKLDVPGNISSGQVAPASSDILTVTAGSAVPAPFSYDQAVSINLIYGPADPMYNNALDPDDLITSYFVPGASAPYFAVNGLPTQQNLFPDALGYYAIAGTVTPGTGSDSCLSPDPANWPAGLAGVPPVSLKAGVRDAPITAQPNTTVPYRVRMGGATLTLPRANQTYYVTATNATAALTADPGCQAKQDYTFKVVNNATPIFELPFGSWTFTYGSTIATATTPVLARATSNAYSVLVPTAAVVTLDPRQP